MPSSEQQTDRLSHVPPLSRDQGLFRALVSEPRTGTMLLDRDGGLLYANPQAAQMFRGRSSRPGGWGRGIEDRYDYMPDGWRRDICDIFSLLLAGTGHVLLRTIWDGAQVYSWASLLEQLPFEVGVLPQSATWATPSPVTPVMLLTSRQAGQSCATEYLGSSAAPVVMARVADLGPLSVLTVRELQVLAALGDGGTLRDAAQRLHRSEKTIDAHRSAIHAKLGITDRVQLATISRRVGLTLDDIDRMAAAGMLKA